MLDSTSSSTRRIAISRSRNSPSPVEFIDAAKSHGFEIVAEFYDAAVSGADPIGERPGFRAMLDRIAGNGVRSIIVESPDRFARDLTVQLTGHDFLKSLNVELIPATAPDFFTEDTPTAVLVRQVLGAIAQFEKTSLVAKLKAARERSGRLGGRKSYAESKPETVSLSSARFPPAGSSVLKDPGHPATTQKAPSDVLGALFWFDLLAQ
jgi:DNA invertase Pin-like site-specific DNA recombinase